MIYEHFLGWTGSVPPVSSCAILPDSTGHHMLFTYFFQEKYNKVLLRGEEFCWCKVDIRYNHISLLFEDWGDSIMEPI